MSITVEYSEINSIESSFKRIIHKGIIRIKKVLIIHMKAVNGPSLDRTYSFSKLIGSVYTLLTDRSLLLRVL